MEGGEKLTEARPLPATADTLTGALGTPMGASDTGEIDGWLMPYALVAETLQTYALPLLSPETVIGLLPPMTVTPPQFAMYPRIGEPPSDAGGENCIVKTLSPVVTTPSVGWPGGVA